MEHKVLSGITVVEFGQFVAVPATGQLLADAGARVIKVEALEGDPTRAAGQIVPGVGRQHLNKNRGKYSVSLDLHRPEGVAIARQLAARADVVLSNFRPGLATSLGLDYDHIRQLNPKVIYAVNTAYGEKGDDAGLPGFDIVVQAYSGLYTSDNTVEDAAPDISLPYCDYMAACLLALSVMMALFHRERTGEGQQVSTSLLAAALYLQNQRMIQIDVVDTWREGFVKQIPSLRAEGKTWAEINSLAAAEQPYRLHRAYLNAYPTADGSVLISCSSRALMRKLLAVLEVDDPWVTDPNWEPPDVPQAYIEQVRQKIAAKLRQQSTAYWVRALHAAGVPAGEVRHWTEVPDHPQIRANDLLWSYEHELVGKTTVVSTPFKMSKTPPTLAFPPRLLGADTAAILTELGYSAEEIASLAAASVIRVRETE